MHGVAALASVPATRMAAVRPRVPEPLTFPSPLRRSLPVYAGLSADLVDPIRLDRYLVIATS